MQCFGDEGGRYAVLLPISDVERPGVIGPTFKLCYTAFGKDTIGHKAGKDDADVARRVFEVAEKLVAEGELKPLRIRVLEGGLAAVEDAVVKVKNGQVRGEKWIVRIADTPGITGYANDEP
jgi:aspyridone synthetase trans-acting enoyl reductase